MSTLLKQGSVHDNGKGKERKKKEKEARTTGEREDDRSPNHPNLL